MLSSSQLIAHAQVNDNNSAIGQDIRAVLYSLYNANFFLKDLVRKRSWNPGADRLLWNLSPPNREKNFVSG